MTPDDDLITTHTHTERARLVELLGNLTHDQWRRPSLCEGWQVREVLAHVTMPFRTSPLRMATGLARARFSFDRYADRDARATAASMDDADLVALLRDNLRHPWRPPGGGPVGALSHDVIHGLDMTEVLGLPRPPAARVGLVLQGATEKSLAYFGVDLSGTRLVATDADATVGSGIEVRLSATDLLLVATGRRALAEVTSRG